MPQARDAESVLHGAWQIIFIGINKKVIEVNGGLI